MRAGSKASNQTKSDAIMDVNQQAVSEVMRQHHVRHLIHGHTHRPAIHDLQIEGHPARRYVLGAWHQEGSMIKASENGIELLFFPF